MRVAFLSAEYPPMFGGIGDYTQQLGQALVERGHNVFVWTVDDGRWTINNVAEPVNHHSKIVHRNLKWDWRIWPAVIAALDRIRPDVLHIQYQTGAYGMHPAINILPWRLRGLLGRPSVVVTAHDLLEPYLFPKAGPLRRFVAKRILFDSDAVVVTNEADRETVKRWSIGAMERRTTNNGQRATLIPIGSNIAVSPPADYDRMAWRALHGVGESETLVAYFGLLGRSKGVDVLVEALAFLPVNVRLFVIGGEATAPQDREYAAAVRTRIAALGLEARITITGQVDPQTVSAHLLAADLAALPFDDGASFRRGSLLAVLAHGVPVVTTRGQGPGVRGQEQLVHEENVLLVPSRNAEALAVAIERVASDAQLRQRLAESGRKLAAHFSWERIAGQHEALYRTLVEPQMTADERR